MRIDPPAVMGALSVTPPAEAMRLKPEPALSAWFTVKPLDPVALMTMGVIARALFRAVRLAAPNVVAKSVFRAE